MSKVVVLGGGLGGVAVAQALDRAGNGGGVSVTLVSARDFVLVKWSTLRGATHGGGDWGKRAMLPLNEGGVLKKEGNRVVVGVATRVDPERKVVAMQNGEEIPYDVLVCATGTRNFSPAEPPVGQNTRDETVAYWRKTRDALKRAKSIIVVGGGAAGLEMTGEVVDVMKAAKTKDLTVRLIVGKSGLLSTTVPPLPVSFLNHWERLLKDSGVEVINDSFRFQGDALRDEPLLSPPDKKVELASGKVLEGVDLVIFALGSKPQSTEIYPPEWLDEKTREMKCDPKTLLVDGRTDVFAVGDLSRTGLTKTGYDAMEDGKVVAKNVLVALAHAKETREKMLAKMSKISHARMLVISFGRSKGLSMYPWGESGNWMTAWVKSKGLFANLYWGTVLGKNAPKVVKEDGE